MKPKILPLFSICFIMKASLCNGVNWGKIKCAVDTDQTIQDGTSDMNRFQWLGVIQHSFFIGGKTRFAVTTAILIHPGYAMASAEDVSKIVSDDLMNTTKLIFWRSAKDKFAVNINDYVLHPDYLDKVTFATIALVQLTNWMVAGINAPVLPVCLPTRGGGAFENLYAVRMTDESAEMSKTVSTMNFVDSQDCEEFYYRSKLAYKKMSPVYSICAVALNETGACVWDGGAALITRQNWGYWGLLGFGVRGPGCGAPARFINIHSNLGWIDEVINSSPVQAGSDEEVHRFYRRQLSPYKLIIYKSDVKLPNEFGQCERKERGSVMYKDAAELLMNKNFGQGFFYAEVWQIAQFRCLTVQMTTSARTKAAVWVEHHCHMELHGEALGMRQPDLRRTECFYYFKSSAHIEFRFFFSFKASIEVTLYGFTEPIRWIPNPFMRTESTEPWWPTDKYLKWTSFVPYYLHSHYL